MGLFIGSHFRFLEFSSSVWGMELLKWLRASEKKRRTSTIERVSGERIRPSWEKKGTLGSYGLRSMVC